MQGGVIGGICLLAFLLSEGRGEELDGSKHLDESKVSPTKGNASSIEDSGQSTQDTKTSIILSNDLNNTNTTLVINTNNSIVKESEPSVQSRKAQQFGADIITSLNDLKNPSSWDPLLQSSSRTIESQKAPYKALDTQFDINSELLGGGSTGRDDNIDKTYHLIPQGSAAVPIAKTNMNIQDTGTNYGYPKTKIIKETKQMKNNDHTYYSGLNILPPLYAAHLAGTTNKVTTEESYFSPLFSDSTRLGQENVLERENAKTLPSYFMSQAGFDETRRNSKPEEIKARNADESEYNETMTEYPYILSSKSDSTSSEVNEMRSGVYYDPSYSPFVNKGMSSAKVYAGAQASNPYSFGYASEPVSNSIITASANAQATSSGSSNAQSRVIWPNELIFPYEIPGYENVIKCTRENEMYHFWSIAFDCLVCICVNINGLIQPLCAKCSGCRKPITSESQTFIPEQYPSTPESYVPLPIPDPYVPLPLPDIAPIVPSPPSIIFEPTEEQNPTTPVREVSATCSPLPTGQPFTNPLHPCQVCICKETVIAPGKIDARIECKDSHNCVLPPDVTTIPPIPDVPVLVPLPACENFPPHVTFPHPTDNCRQCKCSLELSGAGVPEQQITCQYDPDCVPKIETTSEGITPPAPPIPIPVESYWGPSSQGPPPNAVTPEEPIPWPPISTLAPPLIPLLPKKGPLPGPSPHDSCRPYPPNQPFQHPWDECQVCTCYEIKSISVVNVEINCYTKPSCCIESPDQVITAVAEASSGDNNEAVAYSLLNGAPTSTFKPSQLTNAYNPDGSQHQGYAEATIIVKNPELYGATQDQAYAQANAIAQNSESQGYAEANALSPNSLNNPVYPGSYQSANAFSNINDQSAGANAIYKSLSALSPYNSGGYQNQAYAEANAEYNSPSVQNPLSSGISQNQAYAEANVGHNGPSVLSPYNSEVSQNQAYAEANAAYKNPSVLNPYYFGASQNQAYAEVNAENHNPSVLNPFSSGVPQNQAYTEANAEYNSLSALNPYTSGVSQNQAYAEATAGYNGPTTPRLYNSEVSQNQAYTEAYAGAQSTLNNSAYQPSTSYQSSKAKGSINSGGINEKYNPLTITYKPSIAVRYNTVSPNLGYPEGIAKLERIISTTYKPAPLYTPYNEALSQNKAYAEAIAQYKDLMNPGLSQNQAIAKANAQYNSLMTSTYKPLIINNRYKPEQSQNQMYAQVNANYNDLLTSTPRSVALYNGYNAAVTQNQAYATANALYKALALTDKPPFYNPYLVEGSQNQAYSEANAQSPFADKNYLLSGPYQKATALDSVSNGGDQTLAIAEALAQSQDYSHIAQPGAKVGVNPLSKPSLSYSYPSNNYHQNPQYSSFSSKPDSGFSGKYETIPLQYTGNYDFNGKADAINILSSPNIYNPYTSGYSQGIPASKLYPSLYPNRNNYEIIPSYHPGQYGGTSGKSTAQALTVTKFQSKSGEGYEGDSAEVK